MHGQSQFTAVGRRRRALTLAAATTALLLSTGSAAGIDTSDAPAGLAATSNNVAENGSGNNEQPPATINAIKLGRKQLRDNDSGTNNKRGLKDKKKDDKKDKKKDKKANKENDDKADSKNKKAPKIDPSTLERPLLDFAVIGFPKTGTSFMEHYLFNTEETFIDNQENCFTDANMDMARHLISTREYTLGQTTDDGYRVKNAVKCPKDLMGPYSVANYAENFPEIKFVVSTRHPVWWFQSRYNYKLRQTYKHSEGQKIWAPPTSELLGACAEGTPYHYGNTGPKGEVEDEKATSVCTDGAKFHHSLSRLGKTPMNTPEELALLGLHTMSVHRMHKAKVFLMEISQFDAEDTVHANQLLADMKDFLGLEHELPPLPEHSSKNLQEEIQEHAINICDAEHAFVRAELVQTGREAYRWIKDYFMQSEDVEVSAEDHFLSLIEQWQFDPCDEATGRELS